MIPKVGDCGSILLVLLHVLLDSDNGDDGVLLLLVQSVGPGLPASTFFNLFSFLQVLTGDDDDLGHGHGQLGEGDDGHHPVKPKLKELSQTS